jgi:AraC family transcriptional regulator of adaptative response / DNA-3-methyladenine glycosylase II
MQMSAKRYRIYQQVLMAKQLLQQTMLSVEKVAESVGFSSARQLQQHVQTHLRLSPSQLRKNTIKNEAMKVPILNNKEGQLSERVGIMLAYRPPYNWPQVRDFFAKRQILGNERVEDGSFTKVLNINACASLTALDANASPNEAKQFLAVKVCVQHKPEQHSFYLSFNAAYSKYTLAIITIVRRMLDLDACPQVIEQALIKAGLTKDELVSGLRIPGVASEFEAGCRAILGQQVSVAAAVNKVNQLHAHFAQSNYADDAATNLERAFPSPNEVANSDLMFLKMPAARRQTLIDLAKFYQSEALISQDNSAININSEEDAINYKALIDIKGIGPWTVHYVALRALGETDIWLDTDLVIKQQIAKLTQAERTLQNAAAAPWRSYLTLNLWSLA